MDILVEAFPSLYQFTFGKLPMHRIALLLATLYRQRFLSLEHTCLAEADRRILGVLILNLGQPIGQGALAGYWRLLRQNLSFLASLRAFFGGILVVIGLQRRIPRASDLVYIEALAVSEAARRQGIGSRLLQEAERRTRHLGRERLALHVLRRNTDAQRLYERVGFQPARVPVQPSEGFSLFRRRSAWSALLMVRRLDG